MDLTRQITPPGTLSLGHRVAAPEAATEGPALPAIGPGPTPLRPGQNRVFVRILVLTERPEDGERISALLGRGRAFLCRCDTVPDIDAALRGMANAHYDVCVIGSAGDDLAAALATVGQIDARTAQLPIILLVEGGDEEFEREAVDRGAMDVLDRDDLEPARLERALRLAIHRKRAAIRQDRLSQLDGLTGLGNRLLLQERLEHALGNARRLQTLAAVMMLDLNGFKGVNDALGHAAGDELLRAVADRMKARLRVSDTIARVGGDEFALVIENLQRPDQAAMIARKLLNAIAPPFTIEGRTVQVTGSLGVAIYPTHAEAGPRLLKLADAAMYAAKARGGNLCLLYGEDVDLEQQTGTRMAADLFRALQDQELGLVFEPQQPLGSERLGVTAALCWRHGEHGLLENDAIAQITESAGLDEALGGWLLGAVCREARLLHKLMPRPFHLGMPILSRRQLAWPDLGLRVQDELQRNGLPRAALELEVDERLLGQAVEAGGTVLEPLRRLGIRLAVRNFGIGSGSLRILRDVPLSTVRLAPELVQQAPGDRARSQFVRAVIRLGRDLGLRVVADGVDSRDQLAFLQGEGCDAVAGSLGGPPLDTAGVGAWLADQAGRTGQGRRA